MNASIRQLARFVAVADAGSFTAAATRLHVHQPALSHEVKLMEQDLGLRLFVRQPKGVTLTATGREVYRQARVVLDEYDGLAELAQRLRRHEGLDLRIGFMAQGPGELLPRALRTFKRRHPQIEVKLQQFGFGDCLLGVDRDLTDVSFSIGPLDTSDGVVVATLFDEHVVVAMPADHRLARRSRVRVGEILDEPLVSDPHPAGRWRDYWDAVEHRLGRPAKISRRAGTSEEFLEAVRLGAGISICPESTPRYYPRPGVVFVPLDDMRPATHSVVWRRDEDNPLVDEFVEIVRALAAERDVVGA